MEELMFLARDAARQGVLAQLGFFLIRFFLVTFFLYLGGQFLVNIPYLQKFNVQPYMRLAIMLLLCIVAILLLLWLPGLRILHEMGLIRSVRYLVWPDIIFSALAMVRLSYLWPAILEWFNRQTQRSGFSSVARKILGEQYFSIRPLRRTYPQVF